MTAFIVVFIIFICVPFAFWVLYRVSRWAFSIVLWFSIGLLLIGFIIDPESDVIDVNREINRLDQENFIKYYN